MFTGYRQLLGLPTIILRPFFFEVFLRLAF